MKLIVAPYQPFFLRKFLFLLLMVFGFRVSLFAQSFHPKNDQLLADIAYISSVDELENHQRWNKVVRKLERKYTGTSEYFVADLFYAVHQKLLSKYRKGSTFSTLLKSGTYDCVSASIMYSILLTYFNIPHKIIETDYHVFLIATLNQKEFILETTDPSNGFIEDPAAVQRFKEDFVPKDQVSLLQGHKSVGPSPYDQSESKTIYKEISLRQLTALQYFNQGLIALDDKNVRLASIRLQQALNLYDSDRIHTVFNIVAP